MVCFFVVVMQACLVVSPKHSYKHVLNCNIMLNRPTHLSCRLSAVNTLIASNLVCLVISHACMLLLIDDFHAAFDVFVCDVVLLLESE